MTKFKLTRFRPERFNRLNHPGQTGFQNIMFNPQILELLLPPSQISVHFDFFESFLFNFDYKYFNLCYTTFDEKYMNGLSFKCISISIIFIKYNITQIKILIVKVEQEGLKKSKWTLIMGRKEYYFSFITYKLFYH